MRTISGNCKHYQKKEKLRFGIMPIKFTALIKKFNKQGEKSGWTYIEIASQLAQKIKSGTKTSFRVKGKLDKYSIQQVALLPMGDGNFIIPLNAEMRKAIGKRAGYSVDVQLEADNSEFAFNSDLMNCIADEPKAHSFFTSLPLSHQKYFSKWIDSAKTDDTKAKRIALAVTSLLQKKGYAEMIRENTKSRRLQ